MSKLSRQEVQGIEFYVSDDGKVTGLSQSGIARLCGIGESAVRALIDRIKTGDNLPESLQGLDLSTASGNTGRSGKDAKVYLADTCAAIIEYYAIEAKNKTQTALYSLRKFNRIGFSSWVKEVVGFSESPNETALLESMAKLFTELKEMRVDQQSMKVTIERMENESKLIKVQYPGMAHTIKATLTDKALPPSADLFTLRDWLELNGLEMDDKDLKRFGRLVSDNHRAMAGYIPRQATKKVDGKFISRANGYSQDQFGLIESCYLQFIS